MGRWRDVCEEEARKRVGEAATRLQTFVNLLGALLPRDAVLRECEKRKRPPRWRASKGGGRKEGEEGKLRFSSGL